MTMRVRFLLFLLLPLAACGDEPETVAPTDSEAVAEGEVLGGTISDAMLPLDTVRSQSPTMERRSATDGASNGAATAPASEAVASSEASPDNDGVDNGEPSVATEPVLETAPAASAQEDES